MSETASGRATGDDLIGRQIGQYEILRELGRGGMATVYLARQTNVNRQVAVKVLPREFMHDPQFIERFKREIQLIADLEHPHILPVYDFGETERIPFIVMRYLGGGTLLEMLIDSLPPLETLVRPVEQVCSALDFAHAEGIIHRDLKPSNILLDERGNAYLSDFGIAQIMQDAGRLTGSAVIGTPAYMSPEQAEGRPLDARADVYSLGVVLFELVTGREPFQADTPMALLIKHITEQMPSPRAYRPDLPTSVENVVLRATMKDPAARYPSTLALAEAFSRAVRETEASQSSIRLPRPPSTQITRVPHEDSQPDRPTRDESPEDLPTVVDQSLPDVPTMPPTSPESFMDLPFEESPLLADDAPTTPSPTRRVSSRFIWRYVAIVGLVLAGTLGLMVLTRSPLIYPAPEPALLPEGFTAARVLDDRAQVAVPEGWTQVDAAEGVLWVAPDEDAFVAARLVEDRTLPGEVEAAAEVEASARYADSQRFTRIDRAEQSDGSLRISFRVPQPEVLYDQFGRGQLDTFYWLADDMLLVVEVFTADEAPTETLLPVLQAVLDSVVLGDAGETL